MHVVFKAEIKNLKSGLRSPKGFTICQAILKRYAKYFHIKIEQQAVCRDHIHLLIRVQRRSLAQHFFRVVAGQIAQKFEYEKLNVTDTLSIWRHRPFTRVVKGLRAWVTARDYVKLNEFEATGRIRYSPERLRGLSSAEWELLTGLRRRAAPG